MTDYSKVDILTMVFKKANIDGIKLLNLSRNSYIFFILVILKYVLCKKGVTS